MSDYLPSRAILAKYADVLVNFALNSGQGVKKGEVVQCLVPDVAKPLLKELQIKILEAGAHPVLRLTPTGLDKDFYSLADADQLEFFPVDYMRARADLIDHSIGIIADVNPRELSKVDPKKILQARNSKKQFRDWLVEKETQGLFTWTLGLWGVEAKAREVGLSLEAYWQQIINACFLDKRDPVKHWREIFSMQTEIKSMLNDLEIEWVHIQGKDVDLTVKIGADRIWKGGSGRNIPSFEIFTSPDWRGTEGWIRFNQPLYRYGQVIKGIYLRFQKGVIVEARAKTGQKFLQEMIQSQNANKLGEFSLTDSRMSRITHVMAETLFDENIGGPEGNTHVAIGMAYKDCYRGDARKLSVQDWEDRGFNDSAEHTDMVSTTNRQVSAITKSGQNVQIYADGKFTLV